MSNNDKHTNNGTNVRQINYLVNSFEDFKASTLLRIKQYFPDKANLFAQDSDGDLFLELHSRIGDILKFQMNDSLNQSQIDTATDQDAIFEHGKARGFYNLKNTPSFGFVNISYDIPFEYVNPNTGTITASDYVITIKRGSSITEDGRNQYIINNDVIFSANSSTATDQQITLKDSTSAAFTVTKKDVFIMRGKYEQYNAVINENLSIGNFFRLQLPRKNITQIIGVKSGKQKRGTNERVFNDPNDLNYWYQYPYLASRSVFQVINDAGIQKVIEIDTPYKYVLQYDVDGNTMLVFGPGRSFINNANQVTSFKNVYAPVSGYAGTGNQAISPQLFLFSSSLGYSPGDTNNKVLSVKYLYGGGSITNVEANSTFRVVNLNLNNIPNSVQSDVKNTMYIQNKDKITGGMRSRNTDQVKQMIRRYGGMQNRVVNAPDYIRRMKNRPNIYGGNMSVNVFKQNGVVYVYLANKTQDNQIVTSISQRIKRMNTTYMTRYLNKYSILDDNFIINYRNVKDIIVNFTISIYEYENKKNIQNDIAQTILDYVKNNLRLQVGGDVDFNSLVDVIRNSYQAVRSLGPVAIFDKTTGLQLSSQYNVLKRYDKQTIYNIADFFSDITVTLI